MRVNFSFIYKWVCLSLEMDSTQGYKVPLFFFFAATFYFCFTSIFF